MGSLNYHLVLLSVLVTGLFIHGTLAAFTYTDGTFSREDAVFVNCSIEVKGSTGDQLEKKAPFKTTIPGALITYIDVWNNNKNGHKATITKTGGGVGNPSVTFYLVSAIDHGFLFQFFIYGRTPLNGPQESTLTGNCFTH